MFFEAVITIKARAFYFFLLVPFSFFLVSIGAAVEAEARHIPSIISLLLDNETEQYDLPFSERPFGELKLIDEVDATRIPPNSEYPANASEVRNILGRDARIIKPKEAASFITYRIGRGKGLKAHSAYVLEFDYPQDVSRSMFVANRGSDFIRGFATGAAVGDSRAQYAPATLSSTSYPLTGDWEIYHQFFFLHERTSDSAQREHQCADRSIPLSEGFDVTIFQGRKYNDPKSEGIAVSKIRLYEVLRPKSAQAPISYPKDLPKRHIFWREEMADEAISSVVVDRRATSSVAKWYEFKMDMGLVLGFNTVGKDLMEFGFNQGFDGEDNRWINNSPPPRSNIWKDIVASAAVRNLSLMPYYEYGGSVGPQQNNSDPGNVNSLGTQRRTKKLFYGQYGPGAEKKDYTPIWWTEGISADLTDPDTLLDFKRVLDKSVIKYKNHAEFAGIWLRTRPSKLPMSFSEQTLTRYNADNPGNRRTLFQLQTNAQSRESYYQWWFDQRKNFLTAIRDHMRTELNQDHDEQILFTPYSTEPSPLTYQILPSGNEKFVKLITDDPAWWKNYTASLANGTALGRRYQYQWNSASPDQAFSEKMYENGVLRRAPLSLSFNDTVIEERFHGIPPADPDSYNRAEGVAMTYSFDNSLHSVASDSFINRFSNASGGQSLVHHFTLNEDNGKSYRLRNRECDYTRRWNVEFADPFDGVVGYVAAAVERNGPYSVISEVRALANGNPINIGYLESSSMSRGFPAYVRRFNQALLSLPAIAAESDLKITSSSGVVVRRYSHGNTHYFAVINPTLHHISSAKLDFATYGLPYDLLKKQQYQASAFEVDLYPGEVRTFKILTAE